MTSAKLTRKVGVKLAIALLPFLVACNDQVPTTPRTPDGSVVIPVPNDSSALSKINHFIPIDSIDLLKKQFEGYKENLYRQNPGLLIPASEAFNKKALLELLQDSTNVGLRIYYGVKKAADGKQDQFRLIIVGVNSQGQDILLTKEVPEGVAAKLGAKAPPPPRVQGGVEYGQCSPPCN